MYILYSKSFEFYLMRTVKLNFSVNIKVVSYPCYDKKYVQYLFNYYHFSLK